MRLTVAVAMGRSWAGLLVGVVVLVVVVVTGEVTFEAGEVCCESWLRTLFRLKEPTDGLGCCM